MMIAKNPYLPAPMRIEKVTVETEDRSIKTFDLSFIHKEDERSKVLKIGRAHV